MDHVGPVRAVEGEQEEHRVVGRERQELSEFARHGRRFRGAGSRWAILLGAEAVAAGLAFLPDARTALLRYLLLFAAGLPPRDSRGAQSIRIRVGARIPAARGRPAARHASSRGLPISPTTSSAMPGTRGWLRAGISPYAHAPSDPEVARLAPEAAAALPHADVRTVYPPAAQAAFRAARGLGEGSFPLKALFAAADLSVVALLSLSAAPARASRRRSMPSTRCP